MSKSKKPVNKKELMPKSVHSSGRVIAPDFAISNFAVPADIEAFLEKEGLAPRYVNIETVRGYGGIHPKGWIPFKLPEEIRKARGGDIFGADPDGFLRKGDLVLAYKKKEAAEHHRAWLDQEAEDNRVNNVRKKNIEQLKDQIKDSGLSDYISVNQESYEDYDS